MATFNLMTGLSQITLHIKFATRAVVIYSRPSLHKMSFKVLKFKPVRNFCELFVNYEAVVSYVTTSSNERASLVQFSLTSSPTMFISPSYQSFVLLGIKLFRLPKDDKR